MDLSLSTADLWAEAEACTGRATVFIVGSPRSGTTWLQRLLASHSRVKTGQESHLFSQYLAPQLRQWRRSLARTADPEFQGRSGLGLGGYLSEDEFLRVLRVYVVAMQRAAGVERGDLFLEKSPSHARVMPEIRAVLPESRFVHLVRDPRDVVASLVAASQGWGSKWAPSDVTEAARVWVSHVEAVREAAADLPPGAFTQVRYEDLAADTPGALQTLCGFLGLEWDAEQIARAVDANRRDKARQGGGTPIPLYGHHRKHEGDVAVEPEGFVRRAGESGGKDALSLKEKKQVWTEVHPTMKALGYSWKLTDWL